MIIFATLIGGLIVKYQKQGKVRFLVSMTTNKLDSWVKRKE